MPPDYTAPCCGVTGKIPHNTRAAAARAIREIRWMQQDKAKRRRSGGGISNLSTYLCRHCDKWHIGHSQKQLTPKSRQRHLRRIPEPE
jgi:hypothetical protein